MSRREMERRALERQLLAEEQWILNALKKLKEQRHCLEVEALHLKHLLKIELAEKAKKKQLHKGRKTNKEASAMTSVSNGTISEVTAMKAKANKGCKTKKMATASTSDSNGMISELTAMNTTDEYLDSATAVNVKQSFKSVNYNFGAGTSKSEDEAACNKELLNLEVTPIPTTSVNDFEAIEEFDSEDDCDKIQLDINMLMNGSQEEDGPLH